MVEVEMEARHGRTVSEHPTEIVERKGVGHPDSICDAVMDHISVALSQVYLGEFGFVLHHNIDKGLLAAGKVERHFGGGRVIKPMELTIGDRATFYFGGKKVPVGDIAVSAARDWLTRNLRHIDVYRQVDFRVVLEPASEELSGIFLRPGAVRCANDTSAAVGYYPLTITEHVVLELERFLNSAPFKDLFPETGEDVKVMALRRQSVLDLTVAMPLLAGEISSERRYFERKEAIHGAMGQFLERFTSFEEITVHYNALDEPGTGLAGVYLSLLGTSAEDADSGQVGRGNRVNGLISLNRPLGTEAAAGKNPVSHVGKIYNVLAHTLAKEIHERIEGVREVYVFLLSRIGTPVDHPVAAVARILLAEGLSAEEISLAVQEIFDGAFAGLEDFCLRLGRGEFPVC
jgi:S-adenosylmethionine synthetase